MSPLLQRLAAGEPVDSLVDDLLSSGGLGLIRQTLASLDDAQEELNQARSEGRSRLGWLDDVIEASGHGVDIRSTLQELLGASEGTAQGQLRDLLRGVVGIALEGVDESLESVSGLVDLAGGFLSGDPETHRSLVTLTAAALLSQSPDGDLARHPLPITIAADLGISIAREAIAVGLGKTDVATATSRVLDRAAVGLGVMVRAACAEGGERGGELLGGWLASYVGMTAIGAQVGAWVGRMAGERIGTALGRGVTRMTRTLSKSVTAQMKKLTQKNRLLT